MEISSIMFWNVILTLVIAPAFWMFRLMMAEVKRIDILLNRTREDYATKNELREDMSRVMEALHRVEDKLDRALQKD
tara:strand:+ start:817 stop:1047 length:231 start_codon:yes stop_codon:yes gene_type:complete